ncbi:DMT family transporter [Micromonospora yasonensis]|uniref:DMT family transporter n=1 Tax=Micromonospora yasonensis TaxID=1128667 RepID=UPI0022317CD5|nr:DMT family transporter [Micromonospora yasonensis]MCW3839568.1 DMT family transporter [Micromonospora yasonensis]
MNEQGRRVRLVRESAALVTLLASTWLMVGASLHEAGIATVSAGRTGFAVLGLLTLTWWSTLRASSSTGKHSTHAVAPRYRWWQVALLALSGVTAYTVLSTVAINLAGPALPTLVMSLTPAVVLVAEGMLARARPPTRTIVGTALAVAGAVLYVIPQLAGALGHDVALGALFAVAAMLSMAFYGLYFARVNRTYQGAMAPQIMPVFAVGAIPLAIWASVEFAAGATVSWTVIGMLALLGTVIYVPAYLLQHRILLIGGPSYSALLGLAVPPLVGVSSAMLHLAGVPPPMQIAGMALTLLGMFLVIRRKLEPAKETIS